MNVKLDILFGRVELDTRLVRTTAGIEGQGRSRHYDRQGQLIETTPWRTNVVMTMGDPEPRRWWQWWDNPEPQFPACALGAIDGDLRDRA